jgi:hypothetical protein
VITGIDFPSALPIYIARKRGIRHPKLTYRAIAKQVGVFSPTTIMQWDIKDMTEGAIRRRLQRRARPRKFTQLEESILCGWVIYRDLTLQSSTTENFREFGYSYFRRTMSASFISKFMKRNRLSLKLVGKAEKEELLQKNIDEAINFLTSFEIVVKLNGLTASQVKVMDKTYLMTSPWHKFVRHMGPRGSNKSRKQCPQRGTGTFCL